MEPDLKEKCEQARSSITGLENYMFENDITKYLVAKNILNDLRRRISSIERSYELNGDPNKYINATNDLNLIIDSIKDNKLDGLVPQDSIDIDLFINILNQMVPEEEKTN